MKTSKPKARRMWANYYDPLPILYSDKESARFCSSGHGIQHAVVPVAVIPLDDVEALVEKAAKSMYADDVGSRRAEANWENLKSLRHGSAIIEAFTSRARAALAAIGVLPKAKKGRK